MAAPTAHPLPLRSLHGGTPAMTLRAQLACQLPMDPRELVAECRWFLLTGTPPAAWAPRLGMKPTTLAMVLRRAGQTDLLRLVDNASDRQQSRPQGGNT